MSANAKRATRWLHIRKWLFLVACAVMLVQIVCGVIWTVANYNTVPSFGDSGEYIKLSKTMVLDEYRPVLYPLLIRMARSIDKAHYHHYIYALQLGLSLFCMSYAVFAIDTLYTGRKRRFTPGRLALWVYGGLYLSMIPMIAFMNLTILTDSIANSLLVLMLAVSIQIIYGGKASVGKGIVLAVTMIGQFLIRADRLYSGLLIFAILAVIAIVRSPECRRKLLLGGLCIAVITYGVFCVVSGATQVQGRNGRIRTDLNFVLLDRVVWPHMAENYEYFPEEIRENISLEEAQRFDQHNNYVMYETAPMLEKRVGREKAGEFYREMARVVWERQSSVVLKTIGETALRALTVPLTHYQGINGWYTRSAVQWNIKCLSNETPEWTVNFDKTGFFVTIVMLVLSLAVRVIDRMTGCFKKRPFALTPFLIASAVICLWFTLGDGAPLNDRYMLIIYVTYSLWPLTTWYGNPIKQRTRKNIGRKER